MKKPKILVIGSSNTDMIIKLDRLPRPGETILGGEFATAAGGKGANQAIAAVRAGGEISFIARVGMDMFGEQAVRRLLEEGINVEYVIRDAVAPSGVALINVAQDGENSIAVAAGANGRLSPADLEQAAKVMAGANLVLMQLETPLMTVWAAAKFAARAKVPVILNPAPARDLPADLLKLVSILTPNEIETELLTGIAVSNEDSVRRAAEALRATGVRTAILTLGARGVFVATASISEFVPGFCVRAVDTTGAGDVFNGALAVALGEGRPLLEAVLFANAAAAISVTRLGAQPSAPTRNEIESFLGQNHAIRTTPWNSPDDENAQIGAKVPSFSAVTIQPVYEITSQP
jgi:ribokinase